MTKRKRQQKTPRTDPPHMLLEYGLAIGIGAGLLVGLILGNLTIGIVVGAVLGAAIGALFDERRRGNPPRQRGNRRH